MITDARVLQPEFILRDVKLLQDSVTYRRGEYRITAELTNKFQTSTQWTVTKDENYGRQETSIVVDPAGKLTIRKPPFGKLR